MTIKAKCKAPYEQNKKLFMQLPDKTFHISSMKFDPSPPPNCRSSKLIVPKQNSVC